MSIALLVMYMWAHGQVAVPKTSVHEACESATLCDGLVVDDTHQHFSGLAPVGGTCPEGSTCYPMVGEPQDVPAVHEDYIQFHKGQWISGGISAAEDIHADRWTCQDKSRILLTAEDGTKHCIKFGGAK